MDQGQAERNNPPATRLLELARIPSFVHPPARQCCPTLGPRCGVETLRRFATMDRSG